AARGDRPRLRRRPAIAARRRADRQSRRRDGADRHRLPVRRTCPARQRVAADHPRGRSRRALRAPPAHGRRPHRRGAPRHAAPAGAVSASYAVQLARRELRGGVRGFRVFLACLVLGVGAIAGIGSLTEAVVAGIRGDARLLLGGDVSARLSYRPAGEAERQFLAASGTLSKVAKLRAMARSLDGDRRSLIELQAVDAAYPLYGEVTLAPAQPLAAALSDDDST